MKKSHRSLSTSPLPNNKRSTEIDFFASHTPTFTIAALLHATISKLELPSLASVQTRAPTDAYPSWSGYNAHYAKGGMSSDKLPSALFSPLASQQQQQQHHHASSPRGLSSSILNGSTYPNKKDSTQVLPSPSQSQNGAPQYSTSNNQFAYGNEGTGFMNTQSNSSYGALDYGHQHHLSQGQPPTPQTATSGGMGSFPPQPSLLQPTYHQPSHGFPQFFPGSNSPANQPPMGVHPQQPMLPLPQTTALNTNHSPLSAVSQGGPQTPQSATTGGYSNHSFDATGQIAPPGMKPRVAATLWEDEGSLCFQVEARGVCVARREGKNDSLDNDYYYYYHYLKILVIPLTVLFRRKKQIMP